MFRWFQILQEVAVTKTPHEKLIEFLEKRGLKREADSLRNGDTTLYLWDNNIGDAEARDLAASLKDNNSLTSLSLSGKNIGYATIKIINEYLQRNKTIAEKKAESLNAEGNDLCHQEKYSEAIEKYKAAIKIKKGLDRLTCSIESVYYEENKRNAEKKYEQELEKRRLEEEIRKLLERAEEGKKKLLELEAKKQAEEEIRKLLERAEEEKRKLLELEAMKQAEEQQQSLKLKQAASVINENKPTDIKDLPKEVTKQDITQENLISLEENIYEVLARMNNKLENINNISEIDKETLQNNIMNKVTKLGRNKPNLQKI